MNLKNESYCWAIIPKKGTATKELLKIYLENNEITYEF